VLCVRLSLNWAWESHQVLEIFQDFLAVVRSYEYTGQLGQASLEPPCLATFNSHKTLYPSLAKAGQKCTLGARHIDLMPPEGTDGCMHGASLVDRRSLDGDETSGFVAGAR
jgi:hypothetical protein